MFEKTATVLDPSWGDRIKVKMTHDGSTKSYFPTEITLIDAALPRTATTIWRQKASIQLQLAGVQTSPGSKWRRMARRRASLILLGRSQHPNSTKQRGSVLEMVDAMEKSLAAKRKKESHVLDPTSPQMAKWDAVMICLLIFTALVTPFEVAFLSTQIDGLYVVNRCVDLGFVCDMGVQCFVKFIDPESGEWVIDLRRIRGRYLRGWFVVDFISILPFDSVSFAVSGSGMSEFKIMRVIRVLRLIKLLRLLRMSRMSSRFMDRFGWRYSSLTLSSFVVFMLVLVHWISCVWRMCPLFCSLWNTKTNWIVETDAFRTKWDEENSEYVVAEDPGALYMGCFGFALQALVLGYGEFKPTNSIERIISLFIFIVAGSTYAYVIGAICGVISSLDLASQEFQSNHDLLNTFFEERAVPQVLAVGMRKYYNHCRPLYRRQFYMNVFSKLSPQMQGQLAKVELADFFNAVGFLECDDPVEHGDFVLAVSREVKMVAYPPDELIYTADGRATLLYVIFRGLVGTENRILGRKTCFGAEMIARDARRSWNALALCYVDLYALSRTNLFKLIDSGSYPRTQKKLRSKAIWMGVKIKMLHIVKVLRSMPGYVPPSIAYKKRKIAFYNSLANKRQRERVQMEKVRAGSGSGDKLGSALLRIKTKADRNQEYEKHTLAETLKQQEISFFRNGWKEGYDMPEELREAFSKRAKTKERVSPNATLLTTVTRMREEMGSEIEGLKAEMGEIGRSLKLLLAARTQLPALATAGEPTREAEAGGAAAGQGP
jgi:potassium voltage-gated channel Eag-related subfamily H protein 7